MGGGGKDGVQHREAWSKLFRDLLELLNNLGIDLEQIILDGTTPRREKCEPSNPKHVLEKPGSRDSILGQVFFWSRQAEVLISVMSELLISSYTTNKCFSLSRLLEIVQSFFGPGLIGCLHNKQTDLERQVLKSVMPRIWTALLKLLAVLVKVIGDDLLPLQVRYAKLTPKKQLIKRHRAQ